MVPASGAKAPTRIFIRVLLPEPSSSSPSGTFLCADPECHGQGNTPWGYTHRVERPLPGGPPGSSTPRNGGPAGGTPGMLTWRPQARSGVKPQPPGDFAQAVVVRSAVTTCQMGPASPGPGTRNARAGPGAALARSPACAGARSERAAATAGT